MFPKQPISSFTVGLLLLSSICGQSPANQEKTATTQEQQEAQKALEQKAFALIEEIIVQAPTLKLTENRVSIQATAADLIWKRDEKRARVIFKQATAGLAQAMSAMDPSDPQYDTLAQALAQLRMSVLDTIARHDPQLALDFLRATRQPAPPGRHPFYSPPDVETQLEGRLASLIAATDPQRALQIAKESLTRGLSYELINTLSQLQATDKEAASTLSQEIFAKLKTENSMTPDVSGIAFNLLQLSRPPQGDEQRFRELLDLLITTALNASLANKGNQEQQYLARNLLSQLQSMMPEIEKYASSRVAALRKRFGEQDRLTDPYTRSVNEMNRLAQTGSAEEILEAAAKMPAESRGQGYQEVIRKAVGQGEYDRARQIANSEALAPLQRKEMLEEIDRQAVWQAANQGKLNEARQMLTKLHSAEERASVLIQVGAMASAQNDTRTARQFLAEAFDIIGGRASNYQRLQAQLQLAQAYAPLDPDRSFYIIAPIVEQLDGLMAAAAALDGFENNYLQDGEWMPSGGSSLSNMVVTCEQQVAALARVDFDRAKSLTDLWQRSEVRLRARLLIAQAVLSNPATSRT